MAMNLSEELRKVLLAGVGAVAVTAEKSKELVEELVKKGELTVEQGKVLNEELKHKKAACAAKHTPTADQVMADIDRMSEAERAALLAKLQQDAAADHEDSTGN